MPQLGPLRWSLVRHVAAMDVEPVLASWDASTHPSQVRLRAYLDRVVDALAPAIDAAAHLALHIDVRLPPDADLLHHNDLENYLTPVAQRLRLPNLVRAGATKALRRSGETSRVELWEVEPDDTPTTGWYVASPIGSTSATAWKTSLRDALLGAGVAEEMPGPLALEISFRCPPRRRNWVNLWKPAGDALGPLLGEPDPRSPFNPADDRVVELALHLDADDAMGDAVRVAVRCAAARRSTEYDPSA